VLFAAFLWYFDKISENKKYTFRQMFIAGLLLAIATLIRPTNIFIGLVFIFWNTFSLTDIKLRLKKFFSWKLILAIFSPFIIVLIPQMIYWNYAYGSPLFYSYPGESFTNWKSPEFLILLFEPNNGLFPYAPILILIFAGIIVTFIKKSKSAFTAPVFFILMSYIFASWYAPSYGCSFGCRPFAEYFAFFALPLASLVHYSKNKILKGVIIFMATLCMLLIIKMTLIYNDNYFYTKEKWNWKEYISLIGRGVKTVGQNFENYTIYPGEIIETNEPHHGKYILWVNKQNEYPHLYINESYTKGTFSPWRYADASIDVKADSSVNFKLVIETDSCGKQLRWGAFDIIYDKYKLNKWQTMHFYDSWIGGNYGDDVLLKFYLWNPDSCAFYVDNLKIILH